MCIKREVQFDKWLKFLRLTEKGWGWKQKTNTLPSIDVGCLEWGVTDIFRLRPDIWENLQMFSGSDCMFGAGRFYEVPWIEYKSNRKLTELNLGEKMLLKGIKSNIYSWRSIIRKIQNCKWFASCFNTKRSCSKL